MECSAQEFLHWKVVHDAEAVKVGAYWLSKEGRYEIKQWAGFVDYGVGRAALPLLLEVERLEAELAALNERDPV
jgi:hypothetical protein